MAYDPRFGSEAQTPAQRARVLAQMQRTFPARRCRSSQQQAIYERYVQGELTWEQVCQLLESRSAP